MELEQNAAEFKARGYNVAALSYDSPAVLKHFADRAKITYPLLSDPESKVIRAFGIFNDKAPPKSFAYGVPYPGTYLIDRGGKVISKYFEDDYTERDTASAILVRQFGAASGASHTTVESKYLTLSSSASARAVRPGQHIELVLDIELKPHMHVYAPGVQEGYKPIEWNVPGAAAPVFPPSETILFAVLNERLPVYTGKLRLVRDLTIAKDAPKALTVEGEFLYQACDDSACYMPVRVPLKWTFAVESFDRERAPADLRHK